MQLPYDCSKCPAYCCSYPSIEVKDRDVRRLAHHFGIDDDTFVRRYTKEVDGERVLRHRRDEFFGTVCTFLDQKTRRCTVYEARPTVCRTYPDRPRCGYWDFLSWEREFQDNDDFIALT